MNQKLIRNILYIAAVSLMLAHLIFRIFMDLRLNYLYVLGFLFFAAALLLNQKLMENAEEKDTSSEE